MFAVRFIHTPLLSGRQRLVHRSPHLTLVYGPPLTTSADSSAIWDQILTARESRYVTDVLTSERPEWLDAVQRNDPHVINCPCLTTPVLKYVTTPGSGVAPLPCPLHDAEAFRDLVAYQERCL